MWALSGTDARRQAMLHKFGYQELSIYDAIYGEKHFFLMSQGGVVAVEISDDSSRFGGTRLPAYL